MKVFSFYIRLSYCINLYLTELTVAFTIKGVEGISKLINIKSLNISRSTLSYMGFKEICSMTNITSLNISDCKGITNQTIKFLKTITNLKSLMLGSKERFSSRWLSDKGLSIKKDFSV